MRLSRVLALLSISVLLAFAVGHVVGQRSGGSAQLRKPLAEAGSRLARSLTIPDAHERSLQLAETFQELTAADLPTVRKTYEQMLPFVDPVAIVLLADWWTRQDPQWALEATSTWPLVDPDLGLATVMRTWAQRDPLAAQLAYQALQEPERREAALRPLVHGWVDSGDVDGAARFLEDLDRSSERQKAVGIFVSAMLARRGMEAVERYAEAVPDDAANRFKLVLYRRVATALTQLDPPRGAAWAERHLDGPFGDTLARRVAVSWVRQDPEAMLAWLRGLPEGRQRDVAIREGYRQWLMLDREPALDWLRQAELAPVLGPAMELFAIATGREDPTEALDWAARIEDDELRERTTVVVARRWLRTDPDAAGAWLETADLPEAWRQRIETEARRREGRPRPAPSPDRG